MTFNNQSTAVDDKAFEEFYRNEQKRFNGSEGESADLYKNFIQCQVIVAEQGNKILVRSCGPLLIQPFVI